LKKTRTGKKHDGRPNALKTAGHSAPGPNPPNK
jgi:hypothetical protein